MSSRVPMRDGYGKALMELCEKRKDVMVLDADVAKSTRTVWIRDKYPEHFLDMGISEQDMVGTAAGLALSGMVPFASTYCVFLAGRAWDQIRTTVCYNDLNVKLGGAHAGISVGPDGATHQALEDVALMRVLPNMTVIVPCDAEETRKATLAMAERQGPCFVRFGREAVPVVTDESTPFEIGKARLCREGSDVTVFANGAMVFEAQNAADALAKEGISVRVYDLHTVKPLDEEYLASMPQNVQVYTMEEHMLAGGFGEYVSRYCLDMGYNVPAFCYAVRDCYIQHGDHERLIRDAKLDAESLAEDIYRKMKGENAGGR